MASRAAVAPGAPGGDWPPVAGGIQEQFPERFPFADLQPILASAAERHDARFVRGDELFPAVPGTDAGRFPCIPTIWDRRCMGSGWWLR